MRTQPIAGAGFGVEILEFDPRAPIADADAAELNRLFDRHRMLLLRGEDIGEEAHIRLMNAITPAVREGRTDKYYSLNSTTREDAYVGGGIGLPFHSDYSFTAGGPIQAVSLAALVIELSEPTSFVDNVAGVKRLPPALRERLRDLRVVQVQSFSETQNDGMIRASLSELRQTVPKEQLAVAVHPVIGRHPRTGEEVLLQSPLVSSHFEGWTEADSRPLLEEITALQYPNETIYDHEWRLGDLLLWDNVALQHGRRPMHGGSERTLRRVVGNPIPIHELMAGIIPKNPVLVTTAEAPA